MKGLECQAEKYGESLKDFKQQNSMIISVFYKDQLLGLEGSKVGSRLKACCYKPVVLNWW